MNSGKILQRFSMFDLVVIALMAALGIATKPIIVPLTHIITGPLYVPGGVIAGGFYMMWIVLGTGIVRKRWTGAMIGLVQAILVLALGIYGTHGAMSIITYCLPGIAADLVLMLAGRWAFELSGLFLAGMAANLTGTFLTSLVFFRLPLVPLLLSLSAASLSGGTGGIIAFHLVRQMESHNMI
jgi:hypothetical protein